MNEERSCVAGRSAFTVVIAHLAAPLGFSTLMMLAGCAYGAASTANGLARSGNALGRLQDSVAMRSSVNFGYMRQPRATITGSIVSLSVADQPKRMQARTLADVVQGRIAGLIARPVNGGGTSIEIRGGSAGFGGSDPLILIDGDPLPAGVVLQGYLASIDATDVVRVDVLKDVSATAIYGTRAHNGVVLITLRHGSN
jgi:TonB-dependent SusC/RagA subfamily outer membrane receptor